MTPLNGSKTHPLRPATIAVLRRLALGPMLPYQLNPGVRDRLSREGLAEERECGAFTSPRVMQWEITEAGRVKLAEIDAMDKRARPA